MTTIRQDDLIESVADALQFISYYHPADFIKAVHEAYEREESQAAKDAMAQILINSRMCAEGKRPICQDTGINFKPRSNFLAELGRYPDNSSESK